MARDRRLYEGEADRLLAACGNHLRALVEALLETGCRKGELLNLRWRDITWEPRCTLNLGRLRAILDIRRIGPDDEPMGPDTFVFGNEVGEKVGSVKTAWKATSARAGITGLHIHDLRRQAASRWLEGGVPLYRIKEWLGHATIAQTSVYLAGALQAGHDDMAQFDQRRTLQVRESPSTTGGQNGADESMMRDKIRQQTPLGQP